jgi:diadenosine tetraphosphatase ApaH/serine/threonine PP2A family protein phosphatase
LKIAFLSDVHSNLEALTVALASLEKFAPDEIICLGDVVGYGADPEECLELVRQRCSIILMGNHDAAVIGREDLTYFNDFARAAVLWTRSRLASRHKEILADFPMVIKQDDMHLVHSTPKNPEAWDYIFSSHDVYDQFPAVDGKICFVGHSHVPGEYKEPRERLTFSENEPRSQRRIVNVGSVGQPRDRDPRLCYALYDSDREEVQFIREEYDIETAANKIKRAGLPPFLAERLFSGW